MDNPGEGEAEGGLPEGDPEVGRSGPFLERKTRGCRVWVLIFSVLLLSWTEPGTGQTPPYPVYGQNVEERASTRLGYWRRDRNAGLGQLVVSYGRPAWMPGPRERCGAWEATTGAFWIPSFPPGSGGVEIPPGLYYLAVRRSSDGALWELVFIDPEESRRKLLDSYDVGTRPEEIPVLVGAPLKFSRTSQRVEKLTLL